jgi:hypothetical protein
MLHIAMQAGRWHPWLVRLFTRKFESRRGPLVNGEECPSTKYYRMEETQEMYGCSSTAPKRDIGENSAQKPKGKRPVNQQELSQAGDEQRESR